MTPVRMTYCIHPAAVESPVACVRDLKKNLEER